VEIPCLPAMRDARRPARHREASAEADGACGEVKTFISTKSSESRRILNDEY